MHFLRLMFGVGLFIVMGLMVMLLIRSHHTSAARINPLTWIANTEWSILANKKAKSENTGLVILKQPKLIVDWNLTDNAADIVFFEWLTSLHVICRTSVRLGKMLDGGWNMCLAPPYRPVQPCLIYSFGISFDFSFDDAASDMLGCTIRSFDPSMNVADYKRNGSVWFYKLGLYDKNQNTGGWKLMTLQSITEHFNESNKIIDYLKFDIESAEWPSIEEMYKSGVLQRVRQVGLEIHLSKGYHKDALQSYYKIIRLLEKSGMLKWYCVMNYYNLRSSPNGMRSNCYEMVYINSRFLHWD